MLEISFGLCKTVGTVKKHGFCPKTGKMAIGKSVRKTFHGDSSCCLVVAIHLVHMHKRGSWGTNGEE